MSYLDTEKTKTVFVLNSYCHDYSEAEKYGTLRNVTEGIVPVFKVDDMAAKVKAVLVDFKEGDTVILSGPTILGMIAITYLFNRHDKITVLVHDAKHQLYVPRTLDKSFIIN